MNYKGIINKQAPDYFSSNISNNYLNPQANPMEKTKIDTYDLDSK